MGSQKSTQTTSLPQFQEDYLTQTLMPKAQEVAEIPFQAYTGDFTSPLAAETQQAGELYGQIGGVGNMTPADYQALTQQNLAGFQGNVIDPTLAAMERRYAQQRVAEDAGVIGSGAFDSSRRAVFEGEREAARDVEMAQTIANLQRQGYDAATAQTMQQLGMGQQALGQSAAGLMGVGSAQQGLTQADLAAQYQEFMREQGMPLQQLGALTAGAGAIPAGLGTQTATQNTGFGGILSAIGAAGQGVAAFSDPRLKENVQHIATSNGIRYYRWTWNDLAKSIGADGTPPTGVMADELQAIHPDLVHRGEDGFLRVDYAGLAERQAAAA